MKIKCGRTELDFHISISDIQKSKEITIDLMNRVKNMECARLREVSKIVKENKKHLILS